MCKNETKIQNIPENVRAYIPRTLTVKGPTTAPIPYIAYDMLKTSLMFSLVFSTMMTLIRSSIEQTAIFKNMEMNANAIGSL